MKRFIALLMVLLLCISSAGAVSLDLPDSAENWLFQDDTVSFSMGLNVSQLLPFGENTVTMINDCLQHINVSITVGNSSTAAAVFAGGVQAALFMENTADGRSVLQTDMLANRTLTSSGSAYTILTGSAETGSAEETAWSFSLTQAIPEAEAAWPALYEALAGYCEDKAVNTKLKGVGTAKWARAARLNKEQCAELHDLFCALLRCGMSSSYQSLIDQLIFSKQFNANVYFTEEGGQAFAVALNGRAKHPNGKYYDIDYLFAFREDGITYRLELGKGKRAGVAVSGTLVQTNTADKYSYDAQWKVSFRSEDGKTTWETDDAIVLNGSGKESRALQGSVNHTAATSGSTDQVLAETTLLDLQMQDGAMTGKVTITGTRSDLPTDSMTLLFTQPLPINEDVLNAAVPYGTETDTTNVYDPTTDPSGYLVGTPPTGVTAYTAPQAPVTVDLDSLSESELTALQDELYQNTAGHILLCLFENVPSSDLTLLMDNVDEAAFLEFADRLFTVK